LLGNRGCPTKLEIWSPLSNRGVQRGKAPLVGVWGLPQFLLLPQDWGRQRGLKILGIEIVYKVIPKN
jgi:hypothetical protein